MTPAQSSPTFEGAFDAFLFAAIGEERNGMPLSVLSALSRLDIDPWADAARLARLPRDAAIAALGQSIARLPPGTWQRTDATAIATRLVTLLPSPAAQAKPAPSGPAARADWRRRATVVIACLVLGLAAYMLVNLITGVEHRSAHGGVDSVQSQTERSSSR